MQSNNYSVAVIENHNSWQGYDQWTNSYSLARISFWGDNGNPTSHADGFYKVVNIF